MDNPIFQKLQDIIERTPRQPQWFGMAEQAINTIYLLGEQPDSLCSNIIKNLTANVFSAPSSSTAPPPDFGDSQPEQEQEEEPASTPVPPTPARDIDMSAPTPRKATMSRSSSSASLKEDTSGSFPLAQLVFTVGHVAIKHIVYLELVEREFKRRKDEKAKRE